MNTLLTRVLSAIVAIILLFVIYLYFHIVGLKVAIFGAVLVAAYELVGILFQSTESKLNRSFFYIFILCIFSLSSLYPTLAAVVFSFFSICFCLISLLTQKKFSNLAALTNFQARSILGFFYVGLLPSFAVRLLDLPNGLWWFLSLLAVVFAGDIGGFFFGKRFGKTALMPLVSPKKTVEGSIGALSLSVFASLTCWTQLTHVSLPAFLILCVSSSIVAQFGDLFESQLKRVAEIKDSGAIMPGHGGILDRVDGVLFASPIMMFGALILERGF